MRVQLVLWTLRHRPWRNLLIAVSVAITVAVMIVFFSTRLEIKRMLDALDDYQYERFQVRPHNLSSLGQLYPIALREDIVRAVGDVKVTYSLWIPSHGPDERPAIAIGAPQETPALEQDLFPIDAESIERWHKDRIGVLMGGGLAEELKLKVGDLGELPTKYGPLKFRLSGIAGEAAAASRCVFHWEYLDQFTGAPAVVNDFRLNVERKKTDPLPLIKTVNELLDTKGLGSELVSERTMMNSISGGNETLIPDLLGVLGVVLLLTTGLAIANTTVIAVRERRAELATLRVLGFKKRVVGSLIVSESLLVCVVGGIVGIGIAWFVMRNGLTLGSSMGKRLTLTTEGLVAGLATSLIVPIIGSTFSAWLAVRAPLAEALRDAG